MRSPLKMAWTRMKRRVSDKSKREKRGKIKKKGTLENRGKRARKVSEAREGSNGGHRTDADKRKRNRKVENM